MQFRLDIPRGERQRQFLDYLDAALRERTSSYSGEATTDEQGTFKSTVSGPFLVEPGIVVQLRWELTIDAAGTLRTIDVACVDSAEHRWEAAVAQSVPSVLTSALVERRQEWF